MVCFRYQYPIVLGDLNGNIGQDQNHQSEKISNLLMEFGLVDLLRNFFQRLQFRHLKTWFQVQKDILLHSRCNYILR